MNNIKIKIDIDEDLTIILKHLEMKDLDVLIKKYNDADDDDDSIDACYANSCIKLLTNNNLNLENDTLKELGSNAKIIISKPSIEMNIFDGTGSCYNNMKIKISGLKEIIRSDIEGFINFLEETGFYNYLYKFNYSNDKPGYMAILHDEGPGYGSDVSTILVFILPS